MSQMDLDMSLEDIAKKRKESSGGRGRGRGKGPSQRERGVNSDNDNSAGRGAKRHSPRPTPYTRDSGGAPEGRWGHSGYVEQNNIKGGNLAARLLANRPPGGLEADDYSSNDTSNTRKRGGGNGGRRGVPDSTMLSRAVADAVGSSSGAGASLSDRLGGSAGSAVPIKGRGALSVKGASGTTVEVRGLVKGTTAEDVKAIFSDKGSIATAVEVPSKNRDTVTVQVKFQSAASAEAARQTFDGQVADGRTISVVVLGSDLLTNALASGITPSKDASFDLLPSAGSTGGGMRSDALVSDPRAQVLTAPKIVGASTRGR